MDEYRDKMHRDSFDSYDGKDEDRGFMLEESDPEDEVASLAWSCDSEDEAVVETEKILRKLTLTIPEQVDERNHKKELSKLDKVEEVIAADADLLERCRLADEKIKNACMKVTMASLAANTALLLPGVGKTIGLLFGTAAAAGLSIKLQRDLITDISDIFEIDVSESQKLKIEALITGAGRAAAVAQKVGTVAIAASKTTSKSQLQAISRAVAVSGKAKYSKFLPLLAPVVTASLTMSSTYLIGKRAKKYFLLRAQKLKENPDAEQDVVIETWSESVKMLTGVDEKILQDYFKDSMDTMINKMKTVSKDVQSYASRKKEYAVSTGKSAWGVVKAFIKGNKDKEEAPIHDNNRSVKNRSSV